jgi:hypothetical protein
MQEVYYDTYDPDDPAYVARLAALRALRKEDYPRLSREWYTAADYECGQESMQWGTYHEEDAVATFLHHLGGELDIQLSESTLLPVRLPAELMDLVRRTHAELYPDCPWRADVDEEIWNDMLRDSPDGNGIEKRTGRRFALETKAAYHGRNPTAYKKALWYQVPQQHNHMATDISMTHCYLVCWSPTRTKIWKLLRDLTFWKLALPLLMFMHKHGLARQPPTRVFDVARVKQLKKYCQQQAVGAHYIGEYASVFSKHRSSDMSPIEPMVLTAEPTFEPSSAAAKQVAPT